MRFLPILLSTFSLLPAVVFAQSTTANTSFPNTWGNFYDYWIKESSSGIDLTRGVNASSAITIQTNVSANGVRKNPIKINPLKSGLVIVDMQNFFLHPAIASSSVGRNIVPALVTLIHASRNASIPILWVNWGLTQNDLINMAPSMWYSFGDVGESFGSEMGTITVNASDPSLNATKGAPGSKEQDLGRMLMRGSWNAELWGVLEDERSQGLADGTDFAFNKNRLSGMWGTSTPLQQFLQDNSITTLFFGGVNTDQCVYGTLLDSAYKGYDTILVTDISATVSPESATEMVVYNSGLLGWVTNSTNIIKGINQSK